MAAACLCACGGGPKILANGEVQPLAITADGSGLYWLATAPSGAPAGVVRGLSGSDSPLTLAAGFSGPLAMTASSGTLFFASSDGTVHSVSTQGGPTSLISAEPPGYTPFAVAVVGSTVYWLSNLPAVEKVHEGAAQLASAPVAGGARTVIAEFPPYITDSLYAAMLTTSNGTLFWAQSDGAIQYLDQAGEVQSLAKHQGQLSGLAIAGGNAYYLQFFSETVALVRKRLGTLDSAQVLAPLPVTLSVANDDEALYIAGPTSVSISSVSLPDGALSTVYSDQHGVSSIALGASAVFAATLSGRILRIDR